MDFTLFLFANKLKGDGQYSIFSYHKHIINTILIIIFRASIDKEKIIVSNNQESIFHACSYARMVILQCPTCEFETPDVEVVGAAAVLQIHGQTHQPSAANQAQPVANRGPKLARPRIKSNSSNEEWNAFTRRWHTFKIGMSISDAAASSSGGDFIIPRNVGSPWAAEGSPLTSLNGVSSPALFLAVRWFRWDWLSRWVICQFQSVESVS